MYLVTVNHMRYNWSLTHKCSDRKSESVMFSFKSLVKEFLSRMTSHFQVSLSPPSFPPSLSPSLCYMHPNLAGELPPGAAEWRDEQGEGEMEREMDAHIQKKETKCR